MHGCVSRIGYLAHENSNGEIRGRSRNEDHSKRVVRNLEEKNVGTIRGESPKQGLTSAKDLIIELPEVR